VWLFRVAELFSYDFQTILHFADEGIQTLRNTLSQCTITCSITWMALCELSLRRRHNRRKTSSSPWSSLDRSCPDILLKWLRQRVRFSFQQTSSIVSGSCDHIGSEAREWILVLRTRHSIPPDTKWPFWSIWRMNTVPNIDVRQYVILKAYRSPISSPPPRVQDPVNHPWIHKIYPVMMKNTWWLAMWLKWHPDEEIAQHADWPPPGSISIHHLKHQRTGGKWIWI